MTNVGLGVSGVHVNPYVGNAGLLTSGVGLTGTNAYNNYLLRRSLTTHWVWLDDYWWNSISIKFDFLKFYKLEKKKNLIF